MVATFVVSIACYLFKGTIRLKAIKVMWTALVCLLVLNAFYQNIFID